jgi:dTDP-4-amino-4,6-dideoxygalactose transaminase
MTPNLKIPFLDLVTPHLELEEDLVEVFRNTLRTAGFIGGPVVESFEHDFARFCDVDYCIGVGSGTDAVRFALMAAGVRPGESVITVPNSFIATTEAISQTGALPEFVDIDDRTYNMDPAKLREYLEGQCTADQSGRLISRRSGRPVSAVVPVHLYGQTADMDPILELADTYNLLVIEDACQAHGADYFSQTQKRWKKAGSMGTAGAFSFYPGKNLGACGEGGAVTTKDARIADTAKMLRDHGQAEKYYHVFEGYNGRLDAVQAGILSVKLKHLARWNAKRRERAAGYNCLLAVSQAGVGTPYEPYWSRAVYHLYVVRSEDREGLMAHLRKAGIGSGIHYPIPLHHQRAYESLGYKAGDFPVCEEIAAEIVSLPMYPQLAVAQQARVVKEILAFNSTFTRKRAEADGTASAAAD